jgi:hypothetical protein
MQQRENRRARRTSKPIAAAGRVGAFVVCCSTVDDHMDANLTGLFEHQKQIETGVVTEDLREPDQLDARKVASDHELCAPRYPNDFHASELSAKCRRIIRRNIR